MYYDVLYHVLWLLLEWKKFHPVLCEKIKGVLVNLNLAPEKGRKILRKKLDSNQFPQISFDVAHSSRWSF